MFLYTVVEAVIAVIAGLFFLFYGNLLKPIN